MCWTKDLELMEAEQVKKPITTEEKLKVTVDAIVISHFIVANLCVVLGALGSLFDSYKSSFTSNGGVDFIYQVLDYPVTVFFGFVIWIFKIILALLAGILPGYFGVVIGYLNQGSGAVSKLQPGSPVYYLVVECTILVGSVMYGALTYIVLRRFINASRTDV